MLYFASRSGTSFKRVQTFFFWIQVAENTQIYFFFPANLSWTCETAGLEPAVPERIF